MDTFAGQKLDRRLNWTEEYIALYLEANRLSSSSKSRALLPFPCFTPIAHSLMLPSEQ